MPRLPEATPVMPTLADAAFDDISALMYASIGLAFTPAKKPLVASRLGPRIAKLGLSGFEAYFELINRASDGKADAAAR